MLVRQGLKKEFPNGLKGIIFDCDGVILDSRAANIAYYNNIRASIGMPNITLDEENFVHMATIDQALFHIIPEHMRTSSETAIAMMRHKTQLLPKLAVEHYLPEFLKWLAPHKVRLGICTNRIDPIDNILKEFNLFGYFETIKTAAEFPPKPDAGGLLAILDEWKMSSAEVIYVGDSKVDEQAAIAAGIPLWAYKNANLRAQRHISDYNEMGRVLAQLF